jgi:hypothetical protein
MENAADHRLQGDGDRMKKGVRLRWDVVHEDLYFATLATKLKNVPFRATLLGEHLPRGRIQLC